MLLCQISPTWDVFALFMSDGERDHLVLRYGGRRIDRSTSAAATGRCPPPLIDVPVDRLLFDGIQAPSPFFAALPRLSPAVELGGVGEACQPRSTDQYSATCWLSPSGRNLTQACTPRSCRAADELGK